MTIDFQLKFMYFNVVQLNVLIENQDSRYLNKLIEHRSLFEYLIFIKIFSNRQIFENR